MAFRLVSSGGANVDMAVVNMPASGVVRPGEPVEFIRDSDFTNGTGGAVVGPAGTAAHSTAIFGVSLDYRQGASDTFARIIPFDESQLWEVDCANAATTLQLGIRHALSASRGYIHNTGADQGMAAAKADRMDAVFLALAMTGSTSGSGKLIGKFLTDQAPVLTDTHV